MNKIIVYCERDDINTLRNVSYELLSKARSLKNEAKRLIKDYDIEIEAISIGASLDEDCIKKAYASGADKFTFIKDDSLNDFCQTIYSRVFVEYFNTSPSDIILFPATVKGRILAPRITTLLNTGLVADCIELEIILKDDDIKLASTRPTFGAQLMATIISKSSPQCATVRENVFKAEFDFNNCGKYFEYLPCRYEETRMKIIKTVQNKICNDVDFSSAKIIFAGGYGLYDGTSNYYEKLKKIAENTCSKYGATRKVVDFNLAPSNLQIGQTGVSVEPELYVAFGISGAIQHIMGMKNSKKIIAVNTDSNAQIFQYSDYKIVADAREIIDELYDLVL